MTPPIQLTHAQEQLWRIPPPNPSNLFKAPAFAQLTDLCGEIYGYPHSSSALANAIRSLGIPCNLPPDKQNRAIAPEQAAVKLHDAFTLQTVRRRHLCPLDLCDELPPIEFGSCQVKESTAEQLADLFDAPRLGRHFPAYNLPDRQFSDFRWLVVEEHIDVDPRPEARALPILFMDLSQDFGEIDPHAGSFPDAVEAALSFLLLAPWEDWVVYPEVNWRGFRLPWIHTVDDDLFVRPAAPPAPSALSMQPGIYFDQYGEEVEIERPAVYNLDDAAGDQFSNLGEARWKQFETARGSSLFNTPVEHFLVRAFLADGMDEIMAHMTAIEAGLGLEMDHRRGLRPKPDPHPKISASERVAKRLAAVLGDVSASNQYAELFELRSSFVHGRVGLGKVPTQLRINARALARRMADALVGQGQASPANRLEILSRLLDQGVIMS